MGYTLGQAAEATGKTKGAISKAIQKGRVSAIRNEDGSYNIDPAELHRVYDPVSPQRDSAPYNGIPKETENLLKIKELEARLEAADQEKRILYDQISDLRALTGMNGANRPKNKHSS